MGSARQARAAERNGVPTLIFASSLGVYAPATSGAPVDEGWTPTVDGRALLATFLDALRADEGTATPLLDPNAGGALRHREIADVVLDR